MVLFWGHTPAMKEIDLCTCVLLSVHVGRHPHVELSGNMQWKLVEGDVIARFQ